MKKSGDKGLFSSKNCPQNWDSLFTQRANTNMFELLSQDGPEDTSDSPIKAAPQKEETRTARPVLVHDLAQNSPTVILQPRIQCITPDTTADISDNISVHSGMSLSGSLVGSTASTPRSSVSGPSWTYRTPQRYSNRQCRICNPLRYHKKKRVETIEDTIFMVDVQCRPVIMAAPLKHVRQILELSPDEIKQMMINIQSFIEKYKLRSGSFEFNFGDWSRFKRHACIKIKLDAVEYVKKFGSCLPKKWWVLYQTNLIRQKARVIQWEACERLDFGRWELKHRDHQETSGIHFMENKTLQHGQVQVRTLQPRKPPFIFTIPVATASVLHLQRAVDSLRKSSVCVLDPDPKNLKNRFEVEQ